MTRVVRAPDAVPYDPPGHTGVTARRLQAHDAVTVGISDYAPGATVDTAPTAAETVYVVLAGELVVSAGDTAVTLGVHDSVHLPRGEVRSVRNDSGAEAVLLVVMLPPDGGRTR